MKLIIFCVISLCFISCADSEHFDNPVGASTCSGGGALVTSSAAPNSVDIADYAIRDLTQEELDTGSQGNYILLTNSTSSKIVPFFIQTQHFADLQNGYTVEVDGAPPTFKVSISCR
ncbi:MAG: hypothetical protein HOO06_00165 [Bdellovibrionaceae bacterium]|jgi:hypothetical protein|nr:hypothetical protein [Pseudobdellovibrionaceae bacterium]